ncbi:MAG: phage terminase large subunit [Parvibaculum sp.]|uniref:phage terminase large subunit n=1 Tax=Parvibaculum sp. TaxID=2024848 RepID=UPI002726DC61|nr:phage terminase large subunit [Parvibaculum sp.]MDO8839643.1 phage terminase large subunit [Parvibaculum sp.]
MTDHLMSTTALSPVDPLKADFRVFLYRVWEHLNLPRPTDVQYDIARYLQHGPKRCIIEAFRGVGKSWVTSAFVCWLLYCNPQLNILVVSASKLRADDFTTFTLRLINDMPELRHLMPGSGQRNSKVAFDVGPARASHAPSVKSVGITGQLAGSRADVIIADDIEIPNNSATEGMRTKLSEAVKEFDAILKPDGRIIYLGTPQTEMSLYNKLPQRGYSMRVWPARYPTAERVAKYGGRLAPRVLSLLSGNPMLVEHSVDPARFSDVDLMEREASYGRSGFALQFMLDTSLSDADRFPLKVADLLVMDVDGDVAPEKVVWGRDGNRNLLSDLYNVSFDGDYFWSPMGYSGERRPYTGSVLVVDPSGRGTDETGVCVAKVLNSQIFIPHLSGLRGGYTDENLQAIADLAKLHKVNVVLIESNFGDGMFGRLLQPFLTRTYPVTIEEVRHSKQKELRIIDTLEPVMNQHRLVIDRSVIEEDSRSVKDLPAEEALTYQLIYQMTRITRDRGALRHDDRLDVLAMAVAYWSEAMGREQDEGIADERFEALKRNVEQTLTNTLKGWTTLALQSHNDAPAPGHGHQDGGTIFNDW